MRKWEYLSRTEEGDPGDDVLQYLGLLGWELIAVALVSLPGGGEIARSTFIFKRPIEEEVS
jgi:hypothetical protein